MCQTVSTLILPPMQPPPKGRGTPSSPYKTTVATPRVVRLLRLRRSNFLYPVSVCIAKKLQIQFGMCVNSLKSGLGINNFTIFNISHSFTKCLFILKISTFQLCEFPPQKLQIHLKSNFFNFLGRISVM